MEKLIEFIHSDLGLVIIAGLFTLLGTGLARLFEKSDQKKLSNQNKLEQYQKKIEELQIKLDLYEAVEQSVTGDYLFQKKTRTAICPICWPNNHKAIPIYEDTDTGKFICSCCKHTGIFNRAKVDRIDAENKAANDALLRTMYSFNGIGQDPGDFYDGHLHRF